jgi:DNA-binding MarR family transcriptional regulator
MPPRAARGTSRKSAETSLETETATRARAPRAAQPADSTEAIADRLHSAAIHLLRRLRREDDAAGLPAPQLSALSVIVFGGPITLGGLAAAEQVRPPTITKIVAALETGGLVTREVQADDKRIVRVRATAKGTKLLQEGRRRRVAALVRDLNALSDDDRSALRAAVDVIDRVTRA